MCNSDADNFSMRFPRSSVDAIVDDDDDDNTVLDGDTDADATTLLRSIDVTVMSCSKTARNEKKIATYTKWHVNDGGRLVDRMVVGGSFPPSY